SGVAATEARHGISEDGCCRKTRGKTGRLVGEATIYETEWNSFIRNISAFAEGGLISMVQVATRRECFFRDSDSSDSVECWRISRSPIVEYISIPRAPVDQQRRQ